jgi:hypothetical protein
MWCKSLINCLQWCTLHTGFKGSINDQKGPPLLSKAYVSLPTIRSINVIGCWRTPTLFILNYNNSLLRNSSINCFSRVQHSFEITIKLLFQKLRFWKAFIWSESIDKIKMFLSFLNTICFRVIKAFIVAIFDLDLTGLIQFSWNLISIYVREKVKRFPLCNIGNFSARLILHFYFSPYNTV